MAVIARPVQGTSLGLKPWTPGRSRFRVLIAAGGGAVLASALLAACGTSSASTGPVTLNFYNFPDPSGAVQSAADNCSTASHGRYTIIYNKLQNAADQQRLQMARRLAAHDASMDILGLDVTWEAEFATGRLDPAVDRHAQAAGHRRHAEGAAADRDLARPAGRGARTTATPSCSGTGRTW